MAEEIAGDLGADAADAAEADADSLRPPKLEDAGLEDCALPPESIMEAFSRAAIFIRSRLIYDYDDDDGSGCCVQDPGPSNEEIPDALVGCVAAALGDQPGPLCGCAGGGDQPGSGGAADEVRVVGVGEEGGGGDRVVVVGGVEGAKEGIRGVDKKKGKGENEEEEEEEEGDGEAILVEDLI